MTSQLITPNPSIACKPGLCLVYVRETFSIGPKYPTAIAGWEASTTKHEDQKFPDDVWVPVWFSLSNDPAGHVALRQPDGGIWSSSHPTSTKPTLHKSLDDIESYYGGRLTYLGWTEDIEDVPVVEPFERTGSQKAMSLAPETYYERGMLPTDKNNVQAAE